MVPPEGKPEGLPSSEDLDFLLFILCFWDVDDEMEEKEQVAKDGTSIYIMPGFPRRNGSSRIAQT